MIDCFAHHRAIKKFPDWVIDDTKRMFNKFCISLNANNIIVYSNIEKFKDYKDSTILVLGGGPSTNELDLNAVERDYLWSCNHFFLNEKFREHPVDLAMIMSEVKLDSKDFLDYRNKFNPFIGFEIHDKWHNYSFDDYKKYFMMHTKFYSKLGIGVRMLLFAAALGAKHIKFAGFDGFKPIYEGNHSFEKNKKTLPSNFSEDIYVKQYEYFWNYILSHFSGVTFSNLGFGSEYHKLLEVK